MAARHPATLNGFPLDLEQISSPVEKAIAVYEFPYRNGGKTEDLGETVQHHRFRAYFFGATYDTFFAVREELKKSTLFELVHPELGLLKGRVASMAPSWDDRQETAEVEFEFIEEAIDDAEPPRVISVEAAVEAAFEAGQVEQMEAFAGEVRAALGAEAGGILSVELDPELGILAQFGGVSLAARAYLQKVDAVVTAAEATLVSVATPANSLISTLDYGRALPGRVVGGIARAIERYTVLLSTAREFPGRFLDSLKLNLRDLDGTYRDFLAQLKMAGAQRLALEAAGLFEADERRRQALKKQESAPRWDKSGNRIQREAVGPIMHVDQVEAALASVRAYIQEAITLDRSVQVLPRLALNLLEHVSRVKMDYEQVVEVDVDIPTPLFLVCQKQGLPYGAVERVAALNPQFPNPNFVFGKVRVYAR